MPTDPETNLHTTRSEENIAFHTRLKYANLFSLSNACRIRTKLYTHNKSNISSISEYLCLQYYSRSSAVEPILHSTHKHNTLDCRLLIFRDFKQTLINQTVTSGHSTFLHYVTVAWVHRCMSLPLPLGPNTRGRSYHLFPSFLPSCHSRKYHTLV